MSNKIDWPFIDIFILNTNARSDIRMVLQKLKHIDYPKNKYRITVTDNNSTDGSKEMLAEDFPMVRVIPLKKNHGMSALNFGFKKRTGELCFVLDDDSYFELISIKKAIEEFRRDPLLGVLACNIFSANGVTEFKYLPQSGKVIDWCDFIGGGSVIRSSVFERVGYFSPDILIYGHEADFSLRLLNAGYRIKYAPSIIARRLVLPNRMNAFRMSLGVRNFLSIYWRYLSLDLAILTSLAQLAEYFVLALTSYTLGAFLSGLTRFIKEFASIYKRRTPIKSSVQHFWASRYPFTPLNVLRRALGIYKISA